MDAFHVQVSEAIEARRAELAEAIVERQYHAQPELVTRYGETGRAKCLQDTMHHLSSISSAMVLSTPETFVDYVVWVRSLLEARNIPAADLALNLICVRDVLRDELPPQVGAMAVEYVEAGLSQLPQVQDTQP
jgi:hypothetical protein